MYSVVVCTRHRHAVLRRCLTSLRALEHRNYELIVVENDRADGTARDIASEVGGRYICEPRAGLSRARNTGANAAHGEFVCFVDDDALVDPAWLTHHDAALADTTIAATTGRIVPFSDSERGTRSQLLDLGEVSFSVDRHTKAWFEIANFGGLGFGSNMVFRKSLFQNGFRFNEALGAGARLPGGEEFYAFFSLIRDGHTVAYVPKAVVRHGGPRPNDRRAQEIAGARGYGAYLAMLLLNEPGFRLRTLRYIFDSLGRPQRSWRRIDPQIRAVNRIRMVIAGLEGAANHSLSRLRH